MTWERLTDRARKVHELSLREALQLGHNYIGTEHILLALIREGEYEGGGVAAQVLKSLGLELNAVRQAIIQNLTAATAQTSADRKLDSLQKRVAELQVELELLRAKKAAS